LWSNAGATIFEDSTNSLGAERHLVRLAGKKCLKRRANASVSGLATSINFKIRHSSEGWNPVHRKFRYWGGLGPSLRWDDGFF
jgi:hypothetical protein